jgi:L-seryl-tRNA(Ser) seleniumtransferase
VPVIDDVGSGVLADDSPLLADEPPVRRSVRAGAALVCFSRRQAARRPAGGPARRPARSGGPRAAAHPLGAGAGGSTSSGWRAGGDAAAYLDPERARREIPVLAMLA